MAAPEGESATPAKSAWWLRHYTFFGTAVGLVFVWLSLTPSLLPRGPLFQGIVSGAAGAIGYALGVFGVWLVRYMRSKETSPAAPRWAWLALVVVGIIGQVLAIIWFHVWQDDVRDFMGVPRLRFWDHPADRGAGAASSCSVSSRSASWSANWCATWSVSWIVSHRRGCRWWSSSGCC